MGGRPSKEPVTVETPTVTTTETSTTTVSPPIIIENGLDVDTFMLINCDGSKVILEKSLLDSLARTYKINIDTYTDFPSKCRAIRRAIKSDLDKKSRDIYAQRPELSINLFDQKVCEDFERNYTHKEWRDFHSKNKTHFLPWEDIISPDLTGEELWNVDSLCKSMRNSLINQGLIKGSDVEKSRLERLNSLIQKAREEEAKRQIAEIQQSVK